MNLLFKGSLGSEVTIWHPFLHLLSLSLAFFILHIFVSQFSVSVNHVYALAILISTFHYSKNVSAIDQVKVFQFSVFGSSPLVSLKSKGDNSFFLFPSMY